MQITRPMPGSLVIRNTPWTLWFFSALWAAIGVALLGVQLDWFASLSLPSYLSPLSDATVSREPIALAVALVMIVSGLLMVARIAATSWTFADGALAVRQARLIGTLTQTYRLHELHHAELQRSTKGATRVVVTRAGEPDLTLTSYYSSGDVTRKQQAVAAINELLGVQAAR